MTFITRHAVHVTAEGQAAKGKATAGETQDLKQSILHRCITVCAMFEGLPDSLQLLASLVLS